MKKFALKLPHSGHIDYGSQLQLWKSLSGRIIFNNIVILSDMDDISRRICKGPIFLAREIYVFNCNKNFVYYWIDKTVFPLLETLNLLSHPCEPSVLNIRVSRINLCDDYSTYKRRWAEHNKRVIMQPHQDLWSKMKEYDSEDIIIL